MLVKDGNIIWDFIVMKCPRCNRWGESLSEDNTAHFIQQHQQSCDTKWYEFEFSDGELCEFTEAQKIEFFVPYAAQVQLYPKNWPGDFYDKG
jgi:hypothetical protein